MYYAKSLKDGSRCAVKQIKLTLAQNQDSSFYVKCLKEVGLLRNLFHPNIIKYLDSFIEEDVLFIVLEWAARGDLKAFIRQYCAIGSYIEEDIIWSYFSQCCEAVRHMHGQRILHRDIKPSNVFIMDDGRIKVGDLGLGRYLDSQSVCAFSQVRKKSCGSEIY